MFQTFKNNQRFRVDLCYIIILKTRDSVQMLFMVFTVMCVKGSTSIQSFIRLLVICSRYAISTIALLTMLSSKEPSMNRIK